MRSSSSSAIARPLDISDRRQGRDGVLDHGLRAATAFLEHHLIDRRHKLGDSGVVLTQRSGAVGELLRDLLLDVIELFFQIGNHRFKLGDPVGSHIGDLLVIDWGGGFDAFQQDDLGAGAGRVDL